MRIQQVAPHSRVNSMASASGLTRYALSSAKAKPFPDEAAFLNDPHNQKMFGIIDGLMTVRDKITQSTKKKDIISQPKFKQGLDGYTKKTADVKKNPKLELSHTMTVDTELDRQYFMLEQQLKEQANTVK